MIGDIIQGIGGFFGQMDANRRNQDNANIANASQREIALENMAMQREFAQKGLQWKMQDASQAGVNPLYALGAQTIAASPVSVGTHVPEIGNELAPLAQMGQDISRSYRATQAAKEQKELDNRLNTYNSMKMAQDIEQGDLQNQLLKIQIQNSTPQVPGPGMSGDYLMDGQGNAVKVEPVTSTATMIGRPGNEAAAIPDVGYARGDDPNMLYPVPAKHVKERIEDSWADTDWMLRNRLFKVLTGGKPPPGYTWSILKQGYRKNNTNQKWPKGSEGFMPPW